MWPCKYLEYRVYNLRGDGPDVRSEPMPCNHEECKPKESRWLTWTKENENAKEYKP